MQYNSLLQLISVTVGTIRINRILLFICFALTAGIIQAQTTWTGAVNHDWNNAVNWTNGVPGSDDVVTIAQQDNGAQIVTGTTAHAKSVVIETNASLQIDAGARIYIDLGSALGASLTIDGFILNRGQILIGETGDAGEVGIQLNSTGGISSHPLSEISIKHTYGTALVIEGTGPDNDEDGDGSGYASFAGILNISENYGAIGLSNNGIIYFGGSIEIRDATETGIINTGFFVVNGGALNIGDMNNPTPTGIENSNTIVNLQQIEVRDPSNTGIRNLNGALFNNMGYVGIIESLGTSLENGGSFENGECAFFDASAWLNNSGTITNAGHFRLQTNDPNINTGSFINNGLIEYPKRLEMDIPQEIPDVINNQLIIRSLEGPCPYTNVFGIGPENGITVSTNWFMKTRSGDIPVGTYNQATNTFTQNANLPVGTSTITITLSGNGCEWEPILVKVYFDGNCTPPADADGDGIADDSDNCPESANADQADEDCDGVGNVCDFCPGGNDGIDNDDDGNADCHVYPGQALLDPSWKCGNNNQKVLVCHNGVTHCFNSNALAEHLAHGDYIGSCDNAGCERNGAEQFRMEEVAAVFPNPAASEAWILLPENGRVSRTIRLTDLRGAVVKELGVADPGVQTLRLDLADVVPGMYLVEIKSVGLPAEILKLVVAER